MARETSTPALQQLIDKLDAGTTTASPRYRLPFDEDDVYTAIGRLCVKDIVDRGMTPDKKALAPYCRKVAKWLTDEKMKPGLILSGNAGTGKTTIVRAVNRLFNAVEVYSKCFISATAMCDNFIYNPGDSESHFCWGNGCRWLMLDDMGEEPTDIKEYGNVKSPVIRVVAGRYERRLPLLATTNLSIEKLEEKYGIRTVDRLKEIAEWVPFNGISHRK